MQAISGGSNEMAIQRAAAVAAAFIVEAALILAVVLSTIGYSTGARPTPAGALVAPAGPVELLPPD
jgi:hypothetical protein